MVDARVVNTLACFSHTHARTHTHTLTHTHTASLADTECAYNPFPDQVGYNFRHTQAFPVDIAYSVEDNTNKCSWYLWLPWLRACI